MEVNVVRSGSFMTVQDCGRRGYRAAGVPLSGAMDGFALRVGNLLVGNPEGAAGFEFVSVGPELEFAADALVALTGATCEGMPSWQPIFLRAGSRLDIGRCVHGSHGYLCFAGGVDVRPILGSRSTYVRGGFGGWKGRLLRNGDVVALGEAGEGPVQAPPKSERPWQIDPRILPTYSSSPTIRILRGAHADEFGRGLGEHEYRVSPKSDRMGFRLEGETLTRAKSDELLSSAVAPGTIQVPADGQPIVLMADAQTLGGYPQIAHVITVDLPVMAQLRPRDSVRFVEVQLETAHQLLVTRERALGMLREGLAEKIKGHDLT